MLGISRRVSICIAAAAAALCIAPGAARASVVLGQTAGAALNDNCTSPATPYTEVQAGTGAAPSYTVPAGGGVITSFSHQGGANETGQLKLKVFRATGNPNEYTVVGNAPMTMAANTLTTDNAQIPVLAGDVLGYTRLVGSAMRCLLMSGDANDLVSDNPGADVADSQTEPFNAPFAMARINISAVLEPDTDGDGFGDETQDNCVGVANPTQANGDPDPLGDACDNCPADANVNQANNDGDAQGDVCDPDDDNDGVADVSDSCPTVAGTGADGCVPTATPILPSVIPTAVTPTPTTPRKKCKKRKAGGAAQVTRKRCKKRR